MKILIPILTIFFVSQAQALICGTYNPKNETITQEDGHEVVITGTKDSVGMLLEELNGERVCVRGAVSGVYIDSMEVCLGGEDESIECGSEGLSSGKKQSTEKSN